MPIVSEVKGDLIKLAKAGKYRAIIHGANCLCVMGSGLAPQIKAAWPKAYEADKRTMTGDASKLGKFSMYHDKELDLMVFNAYTQYSYDRKPEQHDVDYHAIATFFTGLNSMLRSMDSNCDKPDLRPVGIPLIGCGLAGGHWNAVKEIINLVTPDVALELVQYNGG